MPKNFDVIITGAGPAGSSAAILLARAGWRVALVEKQSFPRRKVCGECIAASNFPLLEALGIGQSFFRLAGPSLRQVALIMQHHLVRAELPPYLEGLHQWGVALGREHLDTLLLQQAQAWGTEVFQPWIARNIAGEPGNFTCEIEQKFGKETQILAAPVMIAAHGSWEPAPLADPNGKPKQSSSDLFAFKANYTDTSLEPGLLPLLSLPGGYGGMVIADADKATLAFCIRRDILASCKKRKPELKPAQAAADYVMQSCPEVQRILSGARQSGSWLGAGPIRPGIRIRQAGSGMFLIGNAAGEAHPLIGEGISMAIQSAWLLANTLAPHRAEMHDQQFQARLQQTYARAWKQHFVTRIRLAALFAHAAMRPAWFSPLVPVLKRYPSLLNQFAQWSGKVRAAPGDKPSAYPLLNINNP